MLFCWSVFISLGEFVEVSNLTMNWLLRLRTDHDCDRDIVIGIASELFENQDITPWFLRKKILCFCILGLRALINALHQFRHEANKPSLNKNAAAVQRWIESNIYIHIYIISIYYVSSYWIFRKVHAQQLVASKPGCIAHATIPAHQRLSSCFR